MVASTPVSPCLDLDEDEIGMSSELRCTGDDLCKSGDWIVEPGSLPDGRSPCSRDRYSGTDHLRNFKRPRPVLPGLVSSNLPER
ncbi:1,4-beta-D-glucan cellobiohydrolase C [Aspergillus luchuensis]|uniref:1,4-beta-D-glucan cellobiohydrolase C n=1 Tax=Aspergillus kawachii TaxID=1069201 RepID=A0A146FC19_ASPKA|nr:1,4-beta-D-glucan cellobiohydrolase C [Aspergillus luchuensis]